jgi:hypothetical protein
MNIDTSSLERYDTFTSELKDVLDEISKDIDITASSLQTKKWRTSQPWYKSGKHNECELYQRNLVQNITCQSCNKTNERINTETFVLQNVRTPMKNRDGFEWTEDFDGKQEMNGFTLYYNLKMVCESGGAQTRTLREVYHFISAQLNHLLLNTKGNRCFVNILDGNESNKRADMFKYLLTKEKYASIRNKVFFGDMKMFKEWFLQKQYHN